MSDIPSIKLPVWAVTIIIALITGIVSSVMYVTETRALATQADERLKNIEQGVHQIWEILLEQQEAKRRSPGGS